MAVVSKTDRHGVDNAIEALQQSLFPRLIAYWDVNAVYTSYPRANKNFKKDDLIPEISLDLKESIEVLTEDNVGVNSFWLVSNSRPYSADNKQLIHDVSLIFQADLVKLYGQTNRADEEFNIDVLRELTRKNVFMFNEDITVITTVDAVYSDLTFSAEMKEKIIYTDISNLHVVRFDFEIRYSIDCIPTLAPICAGASETFNGNAISPLANATTKNIIVQSDAGGSPQVGTILTDTPTSLIVEVPAGGTPVVNTSQPSKTGAADLGSFNTGDDGDTNRGAGVDFFTLDDNNPFGNANKFTDTLGTQIYANDVIINWATRNQKLGLTLGLYRIPNAIDNQATHLSNQPYTFAGKSDWFVWNELEGSCFVYRGIFRDPFNYSPLNHSIAASSLNQIWSNYKDNAGGGYRWAASQFGVTGASLLIMSFVVRYYTDAELGI